MLKVHIRRLGDVTVLCLQGQIVTGETSTLRDAVLSQSEASVVVLDLARVSRIDAGGLGLLLELRGQTIFRAVVSQHAVQFAGRSSLSGATLEIEETHDHLGDVRLGRKLSARPRTAKVGKIPARRNETVESVAQPESGLDRAVREVVLRKEGRLRSQLPLPRRGSISPRAAEGGATIRPFLYANYDALCVGHGRYLMQGFAFLQHLDECSDTSLARLGLLCRLDAPGDRVAVRSTERLEERFCLWVSLQLPLEIRGHACRARRIVRRFPAAVRLGPLDFGQAGRAHPAVRDQPLGLAGLWIKTRLYFRLWPFR